MSKPLPKELARGAIVFRELAIDPAQSAIDAEKRTVELAFSSETPVERYWGVEILDHAAASMRTDRIKRGGPLLVDHDGKDQIGVIESVRIDTDRVGRAVVRFGKSARASEMFQDVQDGIRSNVSVGYLIHGAEETDMQSGSPVFRITDWEPYEISLVSVPADPTVGVGRHVDDPSKPIPSQIEIRTMPNENTNIVDEAAIEKRVADASKSALDAERKRSADIIALGNKYADYGGKKLARDAVANGTSLADFQRTLLDAKAIEPKPAADIGLTDKEKRSYSLVRALNYLVNPESKTAREAAAFEVECSRAGIEQRGSQIKGNFYIPHDVLTRQLPITRDVQTLLAQRALSVGTPTAGGNLVATDLLASDFISLLRNAMVITGMGARILTGLQGNVEIPRQTGGSTQYWVGEATDPTTSDPAFNQVPLTPHTVGTYTDMSRRLLLQSSIDIESLVQADLAITLGLAIQSAAIQGGGANQPTGILATSGIGTVVGGANGAAITWGNIVGLETAVAIANADIGTLGYLTNAKVRGALKTTQKFSGANANPIWDNGAEPLNGYRVGVTNAVASNGTKGTGTNLSTILFGNFADLLIGMWGGLDIMVNPYALDKQGGVRVRILQDCDVAVRHPESFSAMTDAIA